MEKVTYRLSVVDRCGKPIRDHFMAKMGYHRHGRPPWLDWTSVHFKTDDPLVIVGPKLFDDGTAYGLSAGKLELRGPSQVGGPADNYSTTFSAIRRNSEDIAVVVPDCPWLDVPPVAKANQWVDIKGAPELVPEEAPQYFPASSGVDLRGPRRLSCFDLTIRVVDSAGQPVAKTVGFLRGHELLPLTGIKPVDPECGVTFRVRRSTGAVFFYLQEAGPGNGTRMRTRVFLDFETDQEVVLSLDMFTPG
ncbi:MAG TPA: hypothetical protein ENK80_06030 [Rhodobacterales bacterium]|nr:hypothetical protein [Rhodobacterales bacterium]